MTNIGTRPGICFFLCRLVVVVVFLCDMAKNKLGLSGTELGMLYAVNQFFSMLFMLVYGFLQDKLGTRKHLIWLMGIVITLSGPFLIYVYEPLLTSNFKLGMALGAIFFGLGYLAGCGLVESFVEKVSRKFNFEFGTARLWGSLGYAAGTFVGGIFFSINPHINFWCVSVMGVLFLLINVLFKTNSPAPSSVKTRSPEPDALTRNDFLTIFKDTQFWFLSSLSSVPGRSIASTISRCSRCFTPAYLTIPNWHHAYTATSTRYRSLWKPSVWRWFHS